MSPSHFAPFPVSIHGIVCSPITQNWILPGNERETGAALTLACLNNSVRSKHGAPSLPHLSPNCGMGVSVSRNLTLPRQRQIAEFYLNTIVGQPNC